jgi:hypothetical protein
VAGGTRQINKLFSLLEYFNFRAQCPNEGLMICISALKECNAFPKLLFLVNKVYTQYGCRYIPLLLKLLHRSYGQILYKGFGN